MHQSLSAQRLGIGFSQQPEHKENMCMLCCPGSIFYVHRDRIRERPKSFYENIIKCDNDPDFFDYVVKLKMIIHSGFMKQ